MLSVSVLYMTLLDAYGPQGWWPVASGKHRPGFDGRGYHPGLYSIPKTDEERWEILVGTILAQNTSWTNAERALGLLLAAGIDSPKTTLALGHAELAALIRPSGYFNQKAERLASLASFIIEEPGIPDRNRVLSLKGVGPETADSMLLYGWKRPVFVVDLYTIRLIVRLGLIPLGVMSALRDSKRYEHVQNFITHECRKSGIAAFPDFMEFHGLVLAHAKRHCGAKPSCDGCPLDHQCPKVVY